MQRSYVNRAKTSGVEFKGQCGGRIGAVIYLNKAKPLEKENIQV